MTSNIKRYKLGTKLEKPKNATTLKFHSKAGAVQ